MYAPLLGCGRIFLLREFMDRYEEPVATTGNCFNETRVLGRVAQAVTDLIDGRGQTVVEIDNSAVAPELLLQFFPGDQFAGVLDQHNQHAEGLSLQADARHLVWSTPRFAD